MSVISASLILPFWKKIIINPNREIIPIAEARPSSPSIQLIEFVIPTYQKIFLLSQNLSKILQNSENFCNLLWLHNRKMKQLISYFPISTDCNTSLSTHCLFSYFLSKSFINLAFILGVALSFSSTLDQNITPRVFLDFPGVIFSTPCQEFSEHLKTLSLLNL